MTYFVTCKWCKRDFVAKPIGGDFSNAIYPAPHKEGGIYCKGSYMECETIKTDRAIAEEENK